MDKLPMHTLSLVDEKYAALAKLFPNAVTESIDDEGIVTRAIDADVLAQEINSHVVSGREDRYQFTWPDKKKAVLLSNSPIAATLRPCREESVGFDNTENLYIEGDNLDVLKLLRETYLNRIKMIYIDPPYNTGNDFVYEDDFAENAGEFMIRDCQYDESGNRMVKNLDSNGRFHSDWLNMIYPRLRIARDLLREDGVIFVSIDDNEIENCMKICGEVFGYNNFIESIPWIKRVSPANDAKWYSSDHEYVIVFAKNREFWYPNRTQRTEEHNSYYKNPDNDPRGPWNSAAYTCNKSRSERPNLYYAIINPNTEEEIYPNENAVWAYSHEAHIEDIKNNLIYWGADGQSRSPRRKKFLTEAGAVVPRSYWHYNEVGSTQTATTDLRELFNGVAFPYPKPMKLIKKITYQATNADDVILDFFSGSATTAHAVMQLNAEDGGKRKFIMVQLPEVCDKDSEAAKAGYKNICEIGKERIRRAGVKIKADSPLITQALDIGFRVLKLDSSNMKDVYYTPQDTFTESRAPGRNLEGFVDNIKSDRTPEDLIFQVMLDLGVPLSSKIERREVIAGTSSIAGKAVFSVADNYLIACFDRVTEEIITQIAQSKPHYAVFRDSSFPNDATLVNFDQIFNTYSPDTIRKVL